MWRKKCQKDSGHVHQRLAGPCSTNQNLATTQKQVNNHSECFIHCRSSKCRTGKHHALTSSESVKFEFSYTVILHFDPLFEHNPSPFVLSLCSLALVQKQSCVIFHLISSTKLYVVIGLLHSATKCHERRIQRVSLCPSSTPSSLTMMACAAN